MTSERKFMIDSNVAAVAPVLAVVEEEKGKEEEEKEEE